MKFKLWISVILLFSAVTRAGLYDRPDTPNLNSDQQKRYKIWKADQDKDLDWQAIKRAHLDAVAQIIGFYPEHELYFLARDGEHLHDYAKVMAKSLGELENGKRIHLINVSRKSKDDPHLKTYLDQPGIDLKTMLEEGKKVLFVDTGFKGTIPKQIFSLYPEPLRKQLQVQLLVAESNEFPASRAFLAHLNPIAAEMSPSILQGAIANYEHRPRYTPRSDHFEFIEGQWVPAFKDQEDENDGQVNRDEALYEMLDMKDYAIGHREEFKKRKLLWKELRELLNKKDSDGVRIFLRNLLSQSRDKEESIRAKAFVRDAVEIVQINFKDDLHLMPDLKELGILPEQHPLMPNQLALQHPEWKV